MHFKGGSTPCLMAMCPSVARLVTLTVTCYTGGGCCSRGSTPTVGAM